MEITLPILDIFKTTQGGYYNEVFRLSFVAIDEKNDEIFVWDSAGRCKRLDVDKRQFYDHRLYSGFRGTLSTVAIAPNGNGFYMASPTQIFRSTEEGFELFAGNGSEGSSNGEAKSHAKFRSARSIAIGPDNTVYIADHSDNRIRIVEDGKVDTLAGSGYEGFADGPAKTAKFHGPSGLALGDDETLYIADCFNHRIRMLRDGRVTTLAGCGKPGDRDGPALEAQLYCPISIAIAKDRSIYISEGKRNRLRLFQNGVVQSLILDVDRQDALGKPIGDIEPSTIALVEHRNMLCICDEPRKRLVAVDISSLTKQQKTHEPVGLTLSMSLPTDFTITINGKQLQAHRLLLQHRCPALLNLKASFASNPIDHKAIDLFRRLIYSGEVPKPKELNTAVNLAFLCFSVGFIDESRDIIEDSCSSIDRNAIQDLIRAYIHCLDLGGFDAACSVLLDCLHRHKHYIVAKDLPTLIEDNAKMFDLIQAMFVDPPKLDDALWAPRASVTTTNSITDSIKHLYDPENDNLEGSDFGISVLTNSAPRSFHCHSFVLYSTWPYFRKMVDSNMKEAKENRLTFPAPDVEGGLHPQELEMIIELCYTGKISKQVINCIIAESILSTSGLYLASDDLSGVHPLFATLVAFAQEEVSRGIDVYNCISILRCADEMKLPQWLEAAKEFLQANRKQLTKKSSETASEIANLPLHLRQLIEDAPQQQKAEEPVEEKLKAPPAKRRKRN